MSCSVSSPGLLWTSLILPPPKRLALAVSCSALYPVMQWMQPFWVPEWTNPIRPQQTSMLLGQSFSLPESHEPAEGDQKANQPWPYLTLLSSELCWKLLLSFKCLLSSLIICAFHVLMRSSGRIEHLVACALGKTVTSGSLAAGCKTEPITKPQRKTRHLEHTSRKTP